MTVEELTRKLESAENQMNDLQKEIADLKIKLDEVDEVKEIPDYPKFKTGDDYYYLDAGLLVSRFQKTTNKTLVNDFNIFHTPEYAGYFAAKCHEIAMLLHCKWCIDRDYAPDWDNTNNDKYCVRLYHGNKVEYIVDTHYYSEYPTAYFSTYAAAQKAADWMSERLIHNAN